IVATLVLFCFIVSAILLIYSVSLHDALPIFRSDPAQLAVARHMAPETRRVFLDPVQLEPHDEVPHGLDRVAADIVAAADGEGEADRKSTRLNSSHVKNSYAVFCLKKEKIIQL